ncbi:MAG: GNAT family N-acetyltransferase [Chloroflexi bacterium]|nr:GNAT family N-acetyltransferase [Chloroflexota bacterium]
MSADSLLSTRQHPFTGLRPVRLRQDLAAIADLVEVCFEPTLDTSARAIIHEMRMLSRSGPVMWWLSRLAGTISTQMQGFVWLEGGRIVGNVSIAPAGIPAVTPAGVPTGASAGLFAGHSQGYVIANVAVYPEYRRQGIAHRLMHAALDQIARRGRFACLQVEADNPGARALYTGLGFDEQRIFTRWRRSAHHTLPDVPPAPSLIRRRKHSDAALLYALAQTVRPNSQGGLGWLRPTRPAALRPSFWGWQLLNGKQQDYWVVPGAHQVDGAVLVEQQAGRATAYFDLLAMPDRQAEIYAHLLPFVIRRWGGRLRPLVTDHPADDEHATNLLQQYHFQPERTLVHMIWQVPQKGPTT